MPSDKPEYRVYRARRGFLSRFLNRGETDRFERAAGGDAQRPARPGAGGAAGTLGRPPRRPVPGAPPEAPPRERRPISWRRVLAWVVAAMVGWTLLSLVLFFFSAHQQSQKVSASTREALDEGGNLLAKPNNILVLGSDRRPGEDRGRADTIMLMRYGGGKASRLSIPRDTLVNVPGVGPTKVNAAYAFGGPPLMIKTIQQYLGIEVNHLVEVDFKGFPKFVDALGGVNMTFGHCIVSRFEGRTARFSKGKHHLNGQQALDVVRIRKNRCAAEESDLTRARRQQQFLEAVKGRLFSPLTFPRWPWVGWRAPRAIRSDMGGPQLMELYWDIETGGKIKPRILRPVNPGANPLQVSDAEKQAEVQRFLDG